MTCLYCGKKLGFFSRYKDTPFCSEEHLRSHQDELEQALMERLGSKASTIAVRPGNGLVPVADRPIGKKIGSPEYAAEVLETRSAASDENAGSRVDSRAEARDQVPLYEEFFEDFPMSRAHLRVDKPQVPLSSFAIIVQADCCTPSTPDSEAPLALALEQNDLRVDAARVPQVGWRMEGYGALPQINDVEEFGEAWLLFPDTGSLELETYFEPTVDLEPLEYDAVSDGPSSGAQATGALGQRDSIVPRPRNRYPYAASEVASALKVAPTLFGPLNIVSADDWEAIEPSGGESGWPLLPEAPQVEPYTHVPLSIAALLNMTLATAPHATWSQEGAPGSLPVLARGLAESAGLQTECASTPMGMTPILPGAGSHRPVLRSWQRNSDEDRVSPLQFPSLFQLGPVLPPRPRVMAR